MKNLMIAGLGLVLSLGVAAPAIAADSPGAKSVTGTLEDSFCYGTMGAKGSSHKQCAIGCAKKGVPVSLVEKGTDKIYILLPAKDGMALPNDVIDKMEDEVTISGKEYSKGGVDFLVVESVK
ncbi:MAG TPA: hypothetical protein VEC38_14855 [Candidatus Binataceae bacterium]|nr:hypothetical protein [Candidatus Binataceae bacterium]